MCICMSTLFCFFCFLTSDKVNSLPLLPVFVMKHVRDHIGTEHTQMTVITISSSLCKTANSVCDCFSKQTHLLAWHSGERLLFLTDNPLHHVIHLPGLLFLSPPAILHVADHTPYTAYHCTQRHMQDSQVQTQLLKNCFQSCMEQNSVKSIITITGTAAPSPVNYDTILIWTLILIK